MVSTQYADDPYLMELTSQDFEQGAVSRTCYVRPCYTFAADEQFIQRRLGVLRTEKVRSIVGVLP